MNKILSIILKGFVATIVIFIWILYSWISLIIISVTIAVLWFIFFIYDIYQANKLKNEFKTNKHKKKMKLEKRTKNAIIGMIGTISMILSFILFVKQYSFPMDLEGFGLSSLYLIILIVSIIVTIKSVILIEENINKELETR